MGCDIIRLVVILLILTFELYRYLIAFLLINHCKKIVIIYKLSIIDVMRQGILFFDIRIQDIENTINWIIIYQIA